MKKKKSVDLSDVFCVDPDKGQDRHSKYPAEVWIHFARAFAHKAGIGLDPGFYSGPTPDHTKE